MASSKSDALFYHGTWDDTTRSNPAMKWMEAYTTGIIDKRAFDTVYSDWHTEDFTLLKSDGVEIKGGEAAWAALAQIYAPLTANLHDPKFLSCNATPDGYEMIGKATLFANLAGAPAPGDKKIRDKTGKEWDIAIPSAFHFWYKEDAAAKNGLGFLLKRTEIMSDSGPVVVALLRRGVIKPADVGL